MLSTISFVGMGDIVIKEVLEWVFKEPKFVIAASIINRLMDDIVSMLEVLEWVFKEPKVVIATSIMNMPMDDIVSNEFEQNRVHVTSGIKCYKKHYSVSKQENDINKECIIPTKVPIPLLIHVVNFERVMDLLYKDEDVYTHLRGVMVECVTLMLVDLVTI
ncbi:(-)-germacrene d synthase [Quercus suber]|uniref:(-)-germacrene d synthase n=1 Tax=Quercus suber TaxID=58331 RepID=A0AAW0LHG3_QUESU